MLARSFGSTHNSPPPSVSAKRYQRLIPDDEIVSMMSAFEKRQGAPFSLVTPAAFLNLFRSRHGFVLAP